MQTTETKTNCDECGKQIADGAHLHTVTYAELGSGEIVPSVTLHYHDKCFDRQTALAAKKVDKAAGRG